ncbi:Tripartite-type tricarboxylate transporter, receptor component TctC [Polaromonas sp. YR568]|uniref:Bug family tripartite tricarboxylate transporter substrate binding protein n=1 Tax=Polaromonas sp. YR568 TaxID=1855301 RepID=UPI0008E5D929|nr:tripartite tricarboxylate transporter substrate-binding protein [Polaromonas sp. YR568]SFU52787.1 Tripartite-type tricarboxylate transporter, receptor component TctC [Polaromonas sp. YR568]
MKTKLSSIRSKLAAATAGVIAATALAAMPAHAAWEPTKPVEFVVPAGTGGGADQMARLIQGIIVKHKLMKESLIVVNKSGGAGAEGFLEVKGAKGDPHKIIITLSNLFTTPLATGVPFNWRDMTPVSMMALDQFVLWVNAENPAKNAKDFLAAVKASGPSKAKMGGTGSKQEDQILTVGIEKATGTKFIYVPFKGGGDVAVQLVGKHVDSSVNNPIEAVAQWRAGQLRALCVFDEKRMPYKTKVTDTMSWGDIPTCKEAGVPTDYVMLRGIFAAPGISKDQLDYYVGLLKKVRETPDWKEYMEKGAFNQTAMSGDDFTKWLGSAEQMHRELMKEAGFIAK